MNDVKRLALILSSSLSTCAVLALVGCGGAADDGTRVDLPSIERPIDHTYVRNLTATIEGGVVTRGDAVTITGEFELAEGAELPQLSAQLAGSWGEHETITMGTGQVIVKQIEGRRYSYTTEIVTGADQRAGQVELQFKMSDPTRYGRLYVYRAPVEVLAAPVESEL